MIRRVFSTNGSHKGECLGGGFDMGDFLNNTSMELLEKKLDAVWQRQQIISNNLANAATPGYKAKSLEFETVLDRQLSVTGNSDKSIRSALERVNPKMIEQDGTTAREDGNNVDEDKESIEMARALIEYTYLVNSLSSQISRMKYVVTEGRG
jgi:flagellar basal-body rod protein FlgB